MSTEKRRRYFRELWMAFTTSDEKWISGYAVEDQWVIFSCLFSGIYLHILQRCILEYQFSDYVSSYDGTKSHDMYWIFTSYSLLKLANLVFPVIIRSFDTLFCNWNISLLKRPNKYVYKYNHPSTICSWTLGTVKLCLNSVTSRTFVAKLRSYTVNCTAK